MKKNAVILNIDINTVTCPFLKSVMNGKNVTKEALYPFIDHYIDLPGGAQTQLGAIAFNIFCQFSSTESKVMTDVFTYTEKKRGHGDDVTGKWYETFWRIYREFDIDPWKVWMERCRERGYEAWLSIRMNDAHDTDYEECLKDEYAFRAKWNGYAIGDRYDYYWKCLDYAFPEVRTRMLYYLEEQLDRYDVDALELDFMRDIYCFKYLENPDCAAIMNDFMREVRSVVNEAGEKWGHKIKISARLHRSIEQNLIFGFDVQTWAEENLVDHITVTPRWSSSDDAMPIAEWRRRFPDIEIAAGAEILLRIEDMRVKGDAESGDGLIVDADCVNAMAANYFFQGADQLYLYNFFIDPYNLHDSAAMPTKDVLTRCGDPAAILASPRRHIVMYQDIAPEGCESYRPLPMAVSGEEKKLTVYTGEIPEEKEAKLILGFSEGTPTNTHITVNGIPQKEFRPAEIKFLVDDEVTRLKNVKTFSGEITLCDGKKITLWECIITPDRTSGFQEISLLAEKSCIYYAEISI